MACRYRFFVCAALSKERREGRARVQTTFEILVCEEREVIAWQLASTPAQGEREKETSLDYL